MSNADRRAALQSAYEKCPLPLDQVTDEAQLLELSGQEVWLVPGEERNIKITTPEDFYVFRALSDLSESTQILGLQ